MKRNTLIATVALFASVMVAFSAAAQERPLVLQGGTLIDGTGAAPLPDSVILVENGRIRNVGRRGEVAIPPNAQVIDTTGRTVLPGLVDMHLHARGWKFPLYLKYGVTTVGDIHNDTQWILGQRALLQSGAIKGPRLFVSGARINGPNGGPLRNAAGKVVEDPSNVKTPEAARAYVRYLRDLGVNFIKVDYSVTDQQLAAIYDEAAKYNLPVLGHINNIDTAMSYGGKEIEHLYGVYNAQLVRQGKPPLGQGGAPQIADLIASGKGEGVDFTKTGPLIRRMVDQKVALDIALYSWVTPSVWNSVLPDIQRLANDPNAAFVPAEERTAWVSDPTKSAAFSAESYKATSTFLTQFAAAGGRFTIDTDGIEKSQIVPGLGTHVIMEGVAKMGVSPMQIIQATTLWPAEVMGVGRDYGSVEAGKVADFLVIQGNPLTDMKATRNIQMVIMNGKVVDTKLDPNFVNPLPRPADAMQP